MKPFAEAVIPVIRQEAPGAIVIVGTPTWSQDVDVAARDPLAFENVLYAIHFYAGTHGAELREKVRVASNRVALFCSEWGTTLATGDGGPYPYRQDDQVFGNREGILPDEDFGWYREYTVETPGSSDRGARRFVVGEDGTFFYTDDHYDSFREVVE